MATSEEYLASLGFDTKDVNVAVNQTVTLLSHLGNQFDEVANKSSRAERIMLNSLKDKSRGSGSDTGGQALSRQLEVSSQQTALYNQYLYDEARAANEANASLSRLRYAVYDVSNTMALGGIAALTFTTAIVGTGVAYEREFAEVRRTVGVTGTEADALYDKFLLLSTEIPVAFSSITEIGSLAGQLGVAEDRVASFTETVAMFSATTDVSVEQSATAFGRLDQLIDGINGQYTRLGSSILNVGINSVATESQIIGIASQIAATGNQAGLTADEIIGLSGSLASLGVAPEAARGTVLRVFSEINSAVSQGGAALNDFASVSKMSAQEFQRSWGSDFTTTFLALLSGINENGSQAESTIRELGITATRDVNALLKLSQGVESVSRNLGLAASGFANGGILADNFGIIAETNASRLQVLVQTIQAIAATMAEATAGPLASFLEYLQRGLDALLAFSSSPIGQGIAFFTTILAGTVSVLLLLGAAGLRTAGSFLALRTALSDTYVATMLARGGMQGYIATLLGAAGATRALTAALIGTGVGLLIVGGLTLLGEVIGRIGEAMRGSRAQAEDYFGTLEGLSDAVKADNAGLFADRLDAINESISNSKGESEGWIASLEAAAKAQADLAANASQAGGEIDAQTLRIGKNTQEWLRNALAQSPAFQELFKNLDKLQKLTGSDTFTDSNTGVSVEYEAFNLEEYVRIASTNGTGAATAFFDSWQAGLAAKFSEATDTPILLENVIPPETYTAVTAAGEAIGNALVTGLNEAASSDAQSALLDAVLGPLVEGAEEGSAAINQLVNDVYGAVNAEAQLASATQKLGADFATNGAQVASSGSAIQSVIAAIYASSSGAPEAAARMQGLFNALVSGGYASASQLSGLQAVIASLAGGGTVRAAAFDMGAFSKGIDSVAKSAGGGGGGGGGGAARAIRTLVDYANDLRQVFSRSFDIRFGGGEAADDIASGWNKIRESIAKVNEEIAKYQADMAELTADRAVKEYWLSVAENYGDVLRAGELRAELMKIDNDLTKTSKELSEAQAKGSKTLIGNSQAAIDNRAEILGLVGGYQQYITALAAAGVPQEELMRIAAQLKQDFIAQATQLGYNSAELGVYAVAFDDVTTAINKVPRNITVEANTNPALQALNELQAKLQQVGSGSYSPTITPIINQPYLRLLIDPSDVKYYRMALERGHMTPQDYNRYLYGFRSGSGWTGSGNPWDVAGVVHNRERVLNERGSRIVPRQFVDMANQGRNPFLAMGGGRSSSVKMPNRLVVELSEIDRAIIEKGGAVSVVLSAEQLATATNAADGEDNRRGGG